jgi:ABC-type Fe3+-citrate transport system substrate-binding protein
LNHENPLLPALFSIDLEQEARLDDHEQRLAELEATLTADEQPDTASDSDQAT